MRIIDGDALVMWLSKWMVSSFGAEPTEETEAIRKVCDAVGDMVKELAKDTSGDNISKQAAIDVAIQSLIGWDGMFRQEANCRIRDAINELPSTDRKGHWIYEEHEVAMCDGYRCDQCGFFITWDYIHKSPYFIEEYHFCPNCGARMEGADDD